MNSLTNVGTILAKIADALKTVHNDSQVIINPSSTDVTVILRPCWLRRWLSCCCIRPVQDRTTLAFFQDVFGVKRVHRIVKEAALSDKRFTKSDVEKMHVYASEVTFLDLQQLLEEIKDTSARIRFLDAADTTTLRTQYREVRNISDCTDPQLARTASYTSRAQSLV